MRHACSDIKPRELPGPHGGIHYVHGRIHYGITRSSDTTSPAFTSTHSHAPHRARAAAQQLDGAALRLLKLARRPAMLMARRPVMSSTARAAQHPCRGPGAAGESAPVGSDIAPLAESEEQSNRSDAHDAFFSVPLDDAIYENATGFVFFIF